MELPEQVAGVAARQVRDMFGKFISTESEYDWTGGLPRLIPRKMDAAYISASLSTSSEAAEEIVSKLVQEGWLEEQKLIPTHAGMALAQHIDRPRIARAEAETLLEQVLVWVEAVNSDTEGRVLVRQVDLYGSLARGEPTVGDVDLVVTFTTMDLGEDLQPEDMDREDELRAELSAISEYLSPATELDKLAMPDADYRTIYP